MNWKTDSIYQKCDDDMNPLSLLPRKEKVGLVAPLARTKGRFKFVSLKIRAVWHCYFKNEKLSFNVQALSTVTEKEACREILRHRAGRKLDPATTLRLPSLSRLFARIPRSPAANCR